LQADEWRRVGSNVRGDFAMTEERQHETIDVGRPVEDAAIQLAG
jgi:hypothetical protein